MESRKGIAILGSTGSIGTQALDIISKRPDLFKAEVLTANHNIRLLIEQALLFKPRVVVIANKSLAPQLKEALSGKPIKVLAGEESLPEVVKLPQVDLVLTSMVGYAGLRPTLHAIRAGKDIALANKETLVVAGELIMEAAKAHGVRIIPVDSEHSAIFQCLHGEE
ncbi:MAG: 1-deoxy-D-xylulose-5-phosphate reductoisomerase, partial [Bacteroidales bacterium]